MKCWVLLVNRVNIILLREGLTSLSSWQEMGWLYWFAWGQPNCCGLVLFTVVSWQLLFCLLKSMQINVCLHCTICLLDWIELGASAPSGGESSGGWWGQSVSSPGKLRFMAVGYFISVLVLDLAWPGRTGFLGSFVQGQEAGRRPSFLPLSTGPPASRWRRLWKLLSGIGGNKQVLFSKGIDGWVFYFLDC